MRVPLNLLLVSAALLAGCATQPGAVRSASAELAACIKATGQQEAYLLDVPAPNNALSTQLAVATLEMGGSRSVDELVRVLSGGQVKALVVTGGSDAYTAATLKAALGRLPARTVAGTTAVCFGGDGRHAAELGAAAQRVGLPIFFTSAS